MYYKKVESEEELNIFDSIWIPAWLEKGFELECLLGKVDRYLILNEESEYIGSVSFRPYNRDSPIDDVYPFSHNEILKKNMGSIIEIDNFAIVKKHRGIKNLEKVMLTLTDYARNHQYKYYIATIDYIFYRTIQKFYPAKLFQLHKGINYRGNHLVPIIIDLQHTLTNTDKYKWVQKSIQTENHSISFKVEEAIKINKCRFCSSELNYAKKNYWRQESLDWEVDKFEKKPCPNCLKILLNTRSYNHLRATYDTIN